MILAGNLYLYPRDTVCHHQPVPGSWLSTEHLTPHLITIPPPISDSIHDSKKKIVFPSIIPFRSVGFFQFVMKFLWKGPASEIAPQQPLNSK